MEPWREAGSGAAALRPPAGRLQAAATLPQQQQQPPPVQQFPSFSVDQFTSRRQRQDHRPAIQQAAAYTIQDHLCKSMKGMSLYSTLLPAACPTAGLVPARAKPRAVEHSKLQATPGRRSPVAGRRPARPAIERTRRYRDATTLASNMPKRRFVVPAQPPRTLVLPLPRHGLGIRAAWK